MPDGPATLADSTLVMIDLQNTYTHGVMALEGVEPAIDEAAALLDRARTAGIPIVHVQHDAGAGSPYDVRGEIGAIVDRVAPATASTSSSRTSRTPSSAPTWPTTCKACPRRTSSSPDS